MSGNGLQPPLVPSHDAFVPTFIPLRTPIATTARTGGQAAAPACVVPFAITLQRPAVPPVTSTPCAPPAVTVGDGTASAPPHSPGAPAERRYGGAIVRISDLVGRGAAAGPSAASYAPANSTSTTAARADRCGHSDTTALATSGAVRLHDTVSPFATAVAWTCVTPDVQADGYDASYDPMPTLATRRGTRAMQQQRRGRQASVRRRATRGRRVGRRGSGGGARRRRHDDANDDMDAAVPQRPDGSLYEHRWVTVRGRRQLIYNGRTYKGRSAHAMWRRLKAAGQHSSRGHEAAVREVPSRRRQDARVATADGFRPATELYSSIQLEVSPAGGEDTCTRHPVPPASRLPTKQPLRPSALQLLQIASRKARTTETTAKETTAKQTTTTTAPHIAVTLLDSEDDDVTDTRCSATPAAQQPCRTGVTVPDYFPSDDEDSGGSLNDKDSLISSSSASSSVSVDDVGQVAAATNGQDVVEHDGWVYPADVYAAMVRASHQTTSEVTGTARGGKASRDAAAEDDIPLATLYGAAAATDGRPRTTTHGAPVRGLQVIGSVPEVPLRAPAVVCAAPPPSAYYDDDADVFDGLASQEAEGLFEVAEELGGVRYQVWRLRCTQMSQAAREGTWVVVRSDRFIVPIDKPDRDYVFGRRRDLPEAQQLQSKYASREQLLVRWTPPHTLRVTQRGRNPTFFSDDCIALPGDALGEGGKEGEAATSKAVGSGGLVFVASPDATEACVQVDADGHVGHVVVPFTDALLIAQPPAHRARTASTLFYPAEAALPSLVVRFEAASTQASRDGANAAVSSLSVRQMLAVPTLVNEDKVGDEDEDEKSEGEKGKRADKEAGEAPQWRGLLDVALQQARRRESEEQTEASPQQSSPQRVATHGDNSRRVAAVSVPSAEVAFGAGAKPTATTRATDKEAEDEETKKDEEAAVWEWRPRRGRTWRRYPDAVATLLEDAYREKKTKVHIPGHLLPAEVVATRAGTKRRRGAKKGDAADKDYAVCFAEASLHGAMVQYDPRRRSYCCDVRRRGGATVDRSHVARIHVLSSDTSSSSTTTLSSSSSSSSYSSSYDESGSNSSSSSD